MTRLKDRILTRKSRIRIFCVKDGIKKPWYPSKDTSSWTDWSEDMFHQKEYDEGLEKSNEKFKEDVEEELDRMIRAEVENRYELRKRITECDEFILEIDYRASTTEPIYEEEIPKKIPPRDIIEKKKRLEKLIRQKIAQLEKLESELQKLEEEYEFME